MNSHSIVDFDVGIIGGGPAGSAAACYLSQAGLKCVVLEKCFFPREHVGESLVPCVNRVLEEIGVLNTIDKAGFPRKYGAAWTSGNVYAPLYKTDWHGLDYNVVSDIKFSERKMKGFNQPYTYHVDRGLFDKLLLEHAHKSGTKVLMGVNVTGVNFHKKDRYPSIQYKIGEQLLELTVKMVVDASGRSTVIGNQQKLKIRDPFFDQFALHTWFEDYDRRALVKTDEQADFIYIHFIPEKNIWIWQIPITETITSIGVVTQSHDYRKSKKDIEAYFWDTLLLRPDLHKLLHQSKQVRKVKPEGDYSYAMSELCGDNFVLIGDAARFVDPIFSSGVSVALNSARFASHDIINAFQRNDFSKKSFSHFDQTIRAGVKHWYEFITLYYRLNVLFTVFIQHPEYKLDVLKLLQGDVYDAEEPVILQKMREIVKEVESNPEHIWYPFLGTLSSECLKSALAT